MGRRILIYTQCSGEGHNMISNMLKKTFEQNHEDCEVRIIDYYKDYPSPFRAFVSDKFYKFTIGNIHWLYHLYYSFYSSDSPPKRYPIGMWYANVGKNRRVLATVEEFQPDIIIGTHMFHPIGMTRLKERGKLKVPFYSIITDYTVYPLTEYGYGVEKVITPCPEITEGLVKLGYREDQVQCLGFPVRVKRPAERPNRGKDRISLLIMAGPGRIKTIDRDIKGLISADLPIDVSVLNGKDKRHKRKIDGILGKANLQNMVINNYGYVDDKTYAEILNGADIMVSKCGANTLSEAIMMGKVLITNPDLVGQEYENLEYFTGRIPIFLVDNKNGIADVLKNNKFDQKFFDDYWSLTDGMIPADGYKRYVDFFYQEMEKNDRSGAGQ